MCGHSVISIKTVLTRASKDAVLQFLPGRDPDSCPLDVTIELMVRVHVPIAYTIIKTFKFWHLLSKNAIMNIDFEM